MDKVKRFRGSLMLLLAAFFWGTTFAAQSSAADSIPTFTFSAARSFVGAAFLGLLILIRQGRRGKAGGNAVAGQKKGVMLGGTVCGVILFAAMNFQQGGIAVYPEGAAASGRSGFLTATYVVMVAVCARFQGKKLYKSVYAAVAVCILGMYLLCMAGGVGEIYFGDVLGLACAVFFTAHIMAVDHFSYCESIRLCCMQFLVGGILSTVAAILFEQPDIHMLAAAAGPILYAGILSSGIAYTLQMEGQKYAEPSVAAVIMSLESVFAVLGGWIVLDERLSARELAGCALVFAAVILAQLPQKEHDQ
ncbi:MAG: DMT family transporter [Lachnospiraceae bacterium]|nr:DMT family transporter [Lachnospiraceae bacterium]MCM1240211.1 DMT family transporter [Lachnospiraceae bacterium]